VYVLVDWARVEDGAIDAAVAVVVAAEGAGGGYIELVVQGVVNMAVDDVAGRHSDCCRSFRGSAAKSSSLSCWIHDSVPGPSQSKCSEQGCRRP
jgi:hypothetical protein